MVRAFQPVHRPAIEASDGPLHQVASAERVAGAVQAQHRDTDAREVRIAQLFRLARRVKRISEEQ